MLYLKEIDLFDRPDLFGMFQEQKPGHEMNETEFKKYKAGLVEQLSGANLSTDKNQAVTYVFYSQGDHPLGLVTIKPNLDESLVKESGNLEFWLRPSERSESLETALLSLALSKAKLLGMKEVFLLSDEGNVASLKAIKNKGGIKISDDKNNIYKITLWNEDLSETIKKLEEFFEINAPEFELIVIDSREELDLLYGKKTENWTAGFAGFNRIGFIRPDKLEALSIHKKESHPKRMIHEMSHLFYNKCSDDSRRPAWLNEGLASYLADQKGKEFSLEEKIAAPDFFADQGQLVYRVGYYTVKTLLDKFGKDKLLELIKRMTKDINEEDFNKHFFEIYGFEFTKEELRKVIG